MRLGERLMHSQWAYLLENAGRWVGSFTQLSPEGTILADTPSVVTLEPQDDGQEMRQEICKTPLGAAPSQQVLTYRSLSRSVVFFAGGAFSQGSMQWGPFTAFGAELGLRAEPRRLRLVHLYSGDRALTGFTLIREHRDDPDPAPQPPVTVADLLGHWQGTAVTRYPDLRPPDTYATGLTLTQSGQQVTQSLTFAGQTLTSTGEIQRTPQGDRLHFPPTRPGGPAVQVRCLPGGATATGPATIVPGHPFFLEVGWLVDSQHRQRLIRAYNAQGTWVSVTLVTETRQSTG